MGKGGILVLLLLSIFLISSVSAQPPFPEAVVLSQGIDIAFPQLNVLKLNTDFEFHFHVVNNSNGAMLNSTDVNCTFHLFNSTGNHLFENNGNVGMDVNGVDFVITIDQNNFTKIGEYSYLFGCHSEIPKIGGQVKDRFVVTPTGRILDISESVLYIFLSVFVILLFCLSLFFTIIIPYGNKPNEAGAIIKISKLKYVKLGLIMLDYILMVWVLNTLIGISNNFLGLTLFAGFVGFLFETLNNIALPFGIFIIILAFFEIIRDANILKSIKKLGSYKAND